MPTPSPPAALALGGGAGLVAAVVMNVPMLLLRAGSLPARAAASVLRRTTPDRVPARDARVVHHVAGVLGGVLLAGLQLLLAASLDTVVAGVVAGLVVVALVFTVFVVVVLPRVTVREASTRVVRRSWAVSAVVYGVVATAGYLAALAV